MDNSNQGFKKSSCIFRCQSLFRTYRRKNTVCFRSHNQIRQTESGKTTGLKEKSNQARLFLSEADIPQTHLQKICAGQNVFAVKYICLLINNVSQRIQIWELIHDGLC